VGEDMIRQMVCKLRENRDFCLAALAKVKGLTIPNPDGAFIYSRASTASTIRSSSASSCCSKPKSAWRPASRSAPAAKVTSGSPTPRSLDLRGSHGAVEAVLESRQ